MFFLSFFYSVLRCYELLIFQLFWLCTRPLYTINQCCDCFSLLLCFAFYFSNQNIIKSSEWIHIPMDRFVFFDKFFSCFRAVWNAAVSVLVTYTFYGCISLHKLFMCTIIIKRQTGKITTALRKIDRKSTNACILN